MSTTNIALLNNNNDDALFNQFTKRIYLPRLELATSSRKIVKSGKVEANNWILVKSKDSFTVLGKQFPALALGYRYLALDFTNLKAVINNFDPESAEFNRIKNVSAQKLPPGTMNPCAAGVQFLFVLTGNVFCTYHCTSSSSQAIAGSIRALMLQKKFLTLNSFFKEAGVLSWQAPEVMEYPGQFEIDITAANAALREFTSAATHTSVTDEVPDELPVTQETQVR